jgi:Protein kinase domain
MDTDLVELPLQVKDDGIYWLKKPSGKSAESQNPTVVGDEICFWRRHHRFIIETEALTFWHRLVDEHMLLDRGDGEAAVATTKINEDNLVKLITDSGGYKEGAEYVAAISNARRLTLKSAAISPEMAYQQLIFPPISGLFYSFDPDRYAADSMVYTGIFTYKNEQGVSVLSNGIRPDAAVKFSDMHLVIATMELKPAGVVKDDLQKCVLMSSISALALLRDTELSTVTIPFVLNTKQLADLYTTNVDKGKAPVIKKILSANMSDQGETAMIVAYLAVIVNKVKQDTRACSKAMTLQRSLDGIEAPSSSRSKTNRSEQASSSLPQSAGGKPSTKKLREAGDSAGAATVALCEGGVDDLRVFDLHWCHRDNRRGSPYYFVGVFKSMNLPVFIKVWRDGDERTSRRDVEEEIRLLKVAHERGVPCPMVVDQLTRSAVDSEHGLYHLLVMQQLPNHLVQHEDLPLFAASLIKAVLTLHEAGILHCDIKPNNVLWNSCKKVVCLADFGHAQEESKAKAYVGTVGFTAPEILREALPHSRMTDAYSVGRTLQHVCKTAPDMDEHNPARVVAAKLSLEGSFARITLEGALRYLLSPTTEIQNDGVAAPLPSLSVISP